MAHKRGYTFKFRVCRWFNIHWMLLCLVHEENWWDVCELRLHNLKIACMVFAETEHKHLSQNDRRQSHSVGSDKTFGTITMKNSSLIFSFQSVSFLYFWDIKGKKNKAQNESGFSQRASISRSVDFILLGVDGPLVDVLPKTFKENTFKWIKIWQKSPRINNLLKCTARHVSKKVPVLKRKLANWNQLFKRNSSSNNIRGNMK